MKLGVNAPGHQNVVSKMFRAVATLIVIISTAAIISPAALAAPAADQPPPALLSGKAARGNAIDPVFAHFKVDKLSCKFTEEKRIALLARPLRSAGTIYFARDRGIARITETPKPQQVVLTKTTLKIKKGDHVEEIPLDKSKDLKAFALIFPTLLRGERTELEKAFDMTLYGSEADWWAIAFTPKTDSLKALVKRVVLYGKKGDLFSLQVTEANGDTTDTRLTQLSKNADVKDTDLTTAFGR